MSEDFDPYVEWLGYTVGQRPASHYDLLNIEPTQGDPQAIAHAADVLTSRVRKVRPGKRLAEWQRLLDVIAAAKICLLDPTARSAYDAELRQGISPCDQPASIPVARVPAEASRPAPVASETPAEIAAISVADRRPERRRSPVRSFLLAMLATAVVVVAAAYGASVYRQRQAADATADATDSPDIASQPTPRAGSPGRSTSSSNDRPPRSLPGEENTPVPAEPPAEPPPQPPSPAEAEPPAEPPPPDATRQAAYESAVAAARSAMSARDLEAAGEYLDAAGKSLQTPAEQAEFDRLDALLGHLEAFWAGLRGEMAALRGLEEFTINDAVILVVESSADRITLRARGVNRSYMWFETPHSLVMTLVGVGFADDGVSKVLVGSYLAFDPKGDRARARDLWREAAGMGMDVEGLMAELDEPPPTPGSSPGGGSTASNPPPPSDQASLAAARRSVRQRFQSEYDAATDVRRQAALAEKLLDAAALSATTGEESAVHYVMITEARDLAITAGQPAVVLQAIEMAAGAYSIDVVQMNLAALEGVAPNVRGLTGQREIVAAALATLDAALAAKRTDDAQRLVELALAAAVASKNAQLIRHVRAVAQQLTP